MADRPPTKGLGALAAIGAAPPTAGRAPATASGRAPGTSGRSATAPPPRTMATARTAGGSAVDPLSQELIIKMRVKFGDVAKSVSAQEVITQEVLFFLNALQVRPGNTAKLRDAEVNVLADRIRNKLVGGTPLKNTLATQRRAQLGDEWTKIHEFDMALGKAMEQEKLEGKKQYRKALTEILAKQISEQERKRQIAALEEEEYFRQEQATIKRGEEEAEARRKLQVEIMLKLKDERIHQVEERVARRDAALTRKRVEEALDAARLAHETAEELRREERTRHEAKVALKEFLLQNEANKAIREAEKLKLWEEDAMYQRKWEEQLDKQERDRLERLERVKKVQARQEAMAAAQGENTRQWFSEELMAKFYKEREDARAAEEERRIARERELARDALSTVAVQLKMREEEKLRRKKEEDEYAALVAARVKAAEEAEVARKAALLEKKLKFRAQCEAQMRENAEKRRVVPMTELERRINAKTLDQVSVWESTGRLPSLNYMTHV